VTAPRVLIVEDDNSIREMVALALQDAGYDVVDARDGEVAFELLKGAPADILLVDLRMPLMDGFEFMRRYHAGGGRAPIIVLSASRDVDLTRHSVSAAAIVEKPFDLNDLIATVGRIAGNGV
jgi:two-component system chemotaxis response regulator CheY